MFRQLNGEREGPIVTAEALQQSDVCREHVGDDSTRKATRAVIPGHDQISTERADLVVDDHLGGHRRHFADGAEGFGVGVPQDGGVRSVGEYHRGDSAVSVTCPQLRRQQIGGFGAGERGAQAPLCVAHLLGESGLSMPSGPV